MGSGIAQAAAAAGFPTVARDVAEPLLEKGRAGIAKSLGRLVEKGKLSAQTRDSALARLSFKTDLAALRDCDIVIEAVTEDLELKNGLWRELDRLCPPQTIFASNTSSLTIAEMAVATSRADRFLVTTSAATVDRVFEFARALGKEPVAAVDSPGFIVNLLLVPFLLDAARAREHGVASTVDLDRAMQLGCGHPMGPLALMDFIGLDTVVRIADIMFDAYRETRYAPPPLLRRMVVAGMYGRKNGRGFYDYSVDPPRPVELGLGKA
jgi:3-hydroxybutyryl-CoA dehydrogenase